MSSNFGSQKTTNDQKTNVKGQNMDPKQKSNETANAVDRNKITQDIDNIDNIDNVDSNGKTEDGQDQDLNAQKEHEDKAA